MEPAQPSVNSMATLKTPVGKPPAEDATSAPSPQPGVSRITGRLTPSERESLRSEMRESLKRLDELAAMESR